MHRRFNSIVTIVLLCTYVIVNLVAPNANANVVGSDVQNFNPLTSGLDFVTVHSSETLKPGVFNLGFFLNYGVNTLPYFDNSPQGRGQFNDSILGADLNLGVGLMKNWDAGISFPFVLNQSVKDTNGFRGEFSKNGNTEVRLNTKYRLLGDDSGGVAVVGTANFNRVIDNPYTGDGAGPTYNFELAADTTINKIALGANIGHRWRTPGTRVPGSFIYPLKNQYIASAAGSYLFQDIDTKFITEIFASIPTESSTSDQERSLTSTELLMGIKHDLSHNLALHAGAGTELNHSVSSPDWRIYTGINYTFGPLFQSTDKSEPKLIALPSTPSAPKVEKFLTQNIYFEFDSDKMIGTFADALQELADHLNKAPFKELVIEGHTDSVGGADYNQYLSLKRAQAIRNYMINTHKFQATKISAIGYGEAQPIADNGNFQGRQQNRRVEFKIYR